MPINADRSNLPPGRARGQDTGNPPDEDPWLVREAMTRAVELADEAKGDHVSAHPDVRFKMHMAGWCSRQMSYQMVDAVESDPKDEDFAGKWIMMLGNLVHDQVQAAVLDRYPGSTVEVSLDGRGSPIDFEGSGRGDMVLPEITFASEGSSTVRRVFVEIKSINGFGYKVAASTFKGPPEGPRHGALLQGALGAAIDGADLLIVLYASLEAISIGYVQSLVRSGDVDWTRVGAQWTYDRSEFMPIAKAEARRVTNILAAIDEGKPMPRRIPLEDGVTVTIVDPSAPKNKGAYEVYDGEGNVVGAGTTWQCGYCRFKRRCTAEPNWTPDQIELPG